MTTTPSPFDAPPPGSNIQLARAGDLVTVSVPPSGFKGATRALLIFGILWSAFVASFLIAAVGAVLGLVQMKNEDGQPSNPWLALLFLIPFVAVGVGMLLASFQLARRKAVLLISDDTVVFTQTGPLREVEKSWPRQEVQDVAVGASGTEVNDRPLMQLQLQLSSGKHYGMFTGRSDGELAWLAEQLGRALHPETAALTPENRQAAVEEAMAAVRPERSKVTVESFAANWRMTVPRLGLRGPALGLLVFGIVWEAFVGGIFIAILKGTGRGLPVPPLLIGCAMEVVGFLLILFAIHTALRGAEFSVTGTRFTCTRSGLFGRKTQDWHAADIADVRIADSGTKVNNRPLRQLVIEPQQGRPVKMLTGRDDAELLWLAAELRKALKLQRQPAGNIPGADDPQAGSVNVG